MATNAERQAAYRKRQVQDGESGRIHMVLKPSAKKALEQLAERYSVTQVAMVERLIDKADVPAPTPASQTIADRYREHHINAQASLPETALQKLERFKKKERELLSEMWHEQLGDEKRKLRQEFEASIPERMESLAALETKREAEIRRFLSKVYATLTEKPTKSAKKRHSTSCSG